MILKILILGGTYFIGPHLVSECSARGHQVTLFNRGRQSPPEGAGVEILKGDRENNLKALEGRKWDAIIDTSGYFPRVVETSSKLLSNATAHYTFISSISVYHSFLKPQNDETDLLAAPDFESKEITETSYGPLKVACEKIVQRYFQEKALIIRPGIVAGPLDPTDRVTYWVRRVNEGGDILVGGNPDQPLQFIDVRDLARWVIDLIENKVTGIFNAVKTPTTFKEFLIECQKVTQKPCTFYFADEPFLLSHKVKSGSDLPLWFSSEHEKPNLFNINTQKAESLGLKCRPLSETIAAILKWDLQRGLPPLKTGLSRKREQELLTFMKKNL